MEAATGERIVAFGRVGKPPENPFLPPSSVPISTAAAECQKHQLFRNCF
jgi:hypothetical protein